MKLFIYPYMKGSKSVKALKESLGDSVKIIKRTNSKFKYSVDKVVVNWGSSRLPQILNTAPIFNHPDAVAEVSNKLNFFNKVGDFCRCVPFTTDIDTVVDWLNNGHKVFSRTILNGHSGEGIVPITNTNEIVESLLYTRYVKKSSEWRIHLVDNGGVQCEVLFVQKKMRNRSVPNDEVNWEIRNHKNGFIYASNPETIGDPPQDVIDQAKLAFNNLRLDFGAVDVLYNELENKAYVLEINTAPGLTGTTLTKYVEYFKSILEAVYE